MSILRLAPRPDDLIGASDVAADCVRAAADWLWALDRDMRFIRWEPVRAEAQWLASERVIGLAVHEVAPLAAPALHRGRLRDLRASVTDATGVEHIIALDGGVAAPGAGPGIAYHGIARELSDPAVGHIETLRLVGLLWRAVEALDSALVVYDSDLRVLIHNPKYLEVHDQHRRLAPLVGRSLSEILQNSIACGRISVEAADKVLRRAEQGLAPRPGMQLETENDRAIVFRDIALPGGGFIGLRTDITDILQREAKLRSGKERAEEANRAKSSLLANMSHELRTPLNAVIGFAEVMQGELFGPLGDPRYAGYATDIIGSGRHLLDLINDLLDMARIEAGKREVRLERLDLHEIAEELLRVVGIEAERGGVALRTDWTDALPPVSGDARATRQILLNLLSNAIKFSPPNTGVAVSARLFGGIVRLTVRDQGSGMPAELVARLGEPFLRSESGAIHSVPGTGLGLAIARSLAELQGGKLEVESEVGQGTAVHLTMPIDG